MGKTSKSPDDHSLQKVVDYVETAVDNPEIAETVARLLLSDRHSDIQWLLGNPKTRALVIEQLQAIAGQASRSLLDSLVEGPENINRIRASQAQVDILTAEMMKKQSPLVTEAKYKKHTDSEYMSDEKSFHDARRRNDKRWRAHDANNPKHQAAAKSLLVEAEKNRSVVEDFIVAIKIRTALPDGVLATESVRVKHLKSLFDKVDKFRKTEWGKNATIANVIDLLGARLVVSDLRSLEALMQSVETLFKTHEWAGFRVLRKENKFVVNHMTLDPYRAIHYVIALPQGEQSFEIQLMTMPALIAGDLAHDTIYKPLLGLPDEVRQVVQDYHWGSDMREMKVYLHHEEEVTAELTREQKVERAIAESDYNAFYDLVLNKINLNRPLDEKARNYLIQMHYQEFEKIVKLRAGDEAIFIELARASHNGYIRNNFIKFSNAISDQLGSVLPERAVRYLTKEAQQRYYDRYEHFDGRHSKLSVEDLELHLLPDDKLVIFFEEAFKDLSVSNSPIINLIEQIKASRNDKKARQKIFVMNLNHARFERLFELGEQGTSGAIKNGGVRARWRQFLLNGQQNAIATASLLTQIGGYDKSGKYRDLSVKPLPGFSKRELFTHLFFIAVVNPNSETASLSCREFATNPKYRWARGNDRMVDRGILEQLVASQVKTIALALPYEENPVLVARLVKARYELIRKYLQTAVDDTGVLGKLVGYINDHSRNEIGLLLSLGDKSALQVQRIHDPLYFANFINYVCAQANVPNIFESVEGV